jgi:hypothetical protein
MKYYYIVIDTQGSDGKRCAYVRRFSNTDNIAFAITVTPGVISATIASTKKEAYRIANTWNAVYIANGTYLY